MSVSKVPSDHPNSRQSSNLVNQVNLDNCQFNNTVEGATAQSLPPNTQSSELGDKRVTDFQQQFNVPNYSDAQGDTARSGVSARKNNLSSEKPKELRDHKATRNNAKYDSKYNQITVVMVPRKYIGHIIGKRGWRITSIGMRTNTDISSPSDGSNAFKITGSEPGILDATREINKIIDQCKNNDSLAEKRLVSEDLNTNSSNPLSQEGSSSFLEEIQKTVSQALIQAMKQLVVPQVQT